MNLYRLVGLYGPQFVSNSSVVFIQFMSRMPAYRLNLSLGRWKDTSELHRVVPPAFILL